MMHLPSAHLISVYTYILLATKAGALPVIRAVSEVPTHTSSTGLSATNGASHPLDTAIPSLAASSAGGLQMPKIPAAVIAALAVSSVVTLLVVSLIVLKIALRKDSGSTTGTTGISRNGGGKRMHKRSRETVDHTAELKRDSVKSFSPPGSELLKSIITAFSPPLFIIPEISITPPEDDQVSHRSSVSMYSSESWVEIPAIGLDDAAAPELLRPEAVVSCGP